MPDYLEIAKVHLVLVKTRCGASIKENENGKQ